MRTRSLILIAGLAIAGAVGTGTSAVAQPIDKGHFHDVFTDDPYSCDGLPAQDSGDISGNFVLNQRGSSPFPYYRESVHGTFATTNLLTGGTFTQVFASVSQDHVITDNGDGTITIMVNSAGGWRAYDQFGKLVLKDPDNFRFPFDIDYQGTPVTLGRHRGRRLVPGPRIHRGQRQRRPRLLRGRAGVHQLTALRGGGDDLGAVARADGLQ